MAIHKLYRSQKNKIMKTLFIILFVVAMLSFKANSAKAQVLAQDSMALVNLYDSCNGVNWLATYRPNWLYGGPVSTWYGITVTGNRVTAINLGTPNTAYVGFSDVKGKLPGTLGNLTALDTLCISNSSDSLGDYMPPTLVNLTNVTYLNLSNVKLALDSIPAFINSWTKLKTLDLSYNNIAGIIPESFGNLKDLTILNLSNNKLTGGVPDTLTTLKNLEYLNIGNNSSLGGSIPINIGNLDSLRQLLMFGDSLSGSIPNGIGNLDSLTDLYLNNNQLTATIPASISNLTTLKSVNLSDNVFATVTPIPDLHNSVGLNSFAFNNIMVNDTIPGWIATLPHLIGLFMGNDSLHGNLPVSFTNGNLLQDLYLPNNQLTGSFPASYGTYPYCNDIDLSHNRLSGMLPDNWVLHFDYGNYGAVIFLDDNQFSGPLPYTLGNAFIDLAFIPVSLDSNHFTSVPTSFKNLSFFTASSNNLTFDSLEQVVGSCVAAVMPQKSLLLHLNSNTLSVYAGGTLANDTFHWYKNNALYQTITGDSTLTLTESGNYSVQVTNSIITPATAYGGPGTGFTLYSDTVTFQQSAA